MQIKSKQNNLMFADLYKTRKSTKNRLSNFGLIEETMDLSRILLAVTNQFCNFLPFFILVEAILRVTGRMENVTAWGSNPEDDGCTEANGPKASKVIYLF